MRVEGESGPRYRHSDSLPSSCGDPWETLARPSLRVLQVSSGEQVEAYKKTVRTATIWWTSTKIWLSWGEFCRKIRPKIRRLYVVSPKILAINLCRNLRFGNRTLNENIKQLWLYRLPYRSCQLPDLNSLSVRPYARIIEYNIGLGLLLGIAGEAGYNGILTGVRTKCTQ